MITDKNQETLALLRTKTQQLNAQKNNIDLAITIINSYLAYIFFSPDRLQIEADGGKYSVLVRGEKLPLQYLSEGEKNAIALCYFFSTITEGQNENGFFKKACFTILDDPLSSFDIHNKIGVFSFLRFILAKLHHANPNSRTLILTHQLETIFHLEKLCGDLGKSGIPSNKKLFQLNNKKILEFSIKKHEYTAMIEDAFNYASEKDDDDTHLNYSIGNTLRRILEGFATFMYRKGIEDLSTDEAILSLIKEQDKRKHFENLMYRLVLHSESHYEYQIQAFSENNFFMYISSDEKKRTAKEVLIYLKLINPLHLKSHLKDSAIETIEKWEDQFFPPKAT